MPDPRHLPAPRANSETQRFWDAARERRLLYGHCNTCQQSHYYPRAICPHCFADGTQWRQASGQGTIYSFSLMHRSATGPYIIAYVELAEGPRLLTNIVDIDFERIRIGSPVNLVWKDTEGEGSPPLPFFTLTT
jgi:uncharacterized OB-fold protein